MYDRSGIGQQWKDRVFISLGLWHTYKQANLKVYQKYALTVCGPFFHHLFPGTKFFPKPRLVQVVTMFTYIRLSYKRWRAQLQAMNDDLLCPNGEPDASPEHALVMRVVHSIGTAVIAHIYYI